MQRNTRPEALRAEQEWNQRADCARRASCDFLRDHDDLAPARPHVWLVLLWTCAVASVALILTGCGGGIDDEDFVGPPQEASNFIPAPKPCPADIQCRPDPWRGG